MAPFVTPEMRAAQSVRMKGKSIRPVGHEVTAETRARISAALTGRPLREEHRAKLRGPRPQARGRSMPEAQKQALSKARKGIKPSPELKAKRLTALAAVTATPAYRAKLSSAVREWWVRRKAAK